MIFGKRFSFGNFVSVTCFSVMALHQGKSEGEKSVSDVFPCKSHQELELEFSGRKIVGVQKSGRFIVIRKPCKILWAQDLWDS